MADLSAELSAAVGAAFAAEGVDAAFGAVKRADRPDLAQFQCNGAMAAAKTAGKAPKALAEAVAGRLAGDPLVAKAEVAGPGFLNLSVTDAALAARANQLSAAPETGLGQPQRALKVIIDYAGPNVAKPMHVGHLRSSIIGESLKRLMRARGHTVWGDAHFGDWGFQMGLLIADFEDRHVPLGQALSAEAAAKLEATSLDDLQAIYPAAAGRAKSDDAFRDRARKATAALQQGAPAHRAVWAAYRALSMAAQKRDFAALGVNFDLWNGEADADPFIPAMITDLEAKGLLVEDAGARAIFVHDKLVPKKDGGEGPNIPPLLVVSSEGSAMYGTTDLATIVQRQKEQAPDLSLYVVDQRQADHFEQVFRAAAKAGYAARGSLEHIGFGTMNGADGKPFKTREGGVLRLADLIAMATEKARERLKAAEIGDAFGAEEFEDVAHKVAIAAIKFADLANFRGTSYVFDLDRFMSFEGKTGPYLLYAVVRIRSILRKAEAEGLAAGAIAIGHEAERALALALDGCEAAAAGAEDKRSPHLLAEHAFALAQAFSVFYTQCPILPEKDAGVRASRLALAKAAHDQLVLVLEILGLEAPARM